MYIILGVLLILLLGWVAYGYFSVSSLEQPNYTVIEEKEGYEIRQYEDYIIAETKVSGDYNDAINRGFMKVGGYIFGDNTSTSLSTSKDKIAMTTPVISEQKSEKIAMTTPVISEEISEKIAMTTPVVSEQQGQEWTLAFVMPSQYTLENLPTPNNKDVILKEVTGEKRAVLRFSGWVTASRLQRKTDQLIAMLERDKLEYEGIQSARYNPPWSPPFMNRNEVWAVLK